jgi:hypothetical protein
VLFNDIASRANATASGCWSLAVLCLASLSLPSASVSVGAEQTACNTALK